MANITKQVLKDLIDQNLEDFSNITPDKHREVLYMILECIQYQNDIRFIRMQNSDIPIYFDTSGLGRLNLQYEGWAICNGNNSTVNDNGRTYIGYDPVNYPTLGFQGGTKTHKLTESELPVVEITASQTSAGPEEGSNTSKLTTGSNVLEGAFVIDTFGGGVAHNNMQPYTVILKIQKV